MDACFAGALSDRGCSPGFFVKMTMPSSSEETGRYSSVASSARSPWLSRTGVVWVWKPVIVFGLP